MPGSLSSESSAIGSFEGIEALFAMPTSGFNWGEIHSENAVDIANYCGAPVFSVYQGEVVADDHYGAGTEEWNGGYGHFILLEHPGGLKTRYAHLGAITVKERDSVRQGDLIGYVGATGNVHGATGCHLHFEVLGGENPFAG